MKHPKLFLSLATLNVILSIAMVTQEVHNNTGTDHQIACDDKANHEQDVCLSAVQNSPAWPDSAQPLIDACGATAQTQISVCAAWKVW